MNSIEATVGRTNCDYCENGSEAVDPQHSNCDRCLDGREATPGRENCIKCADGITEATSDRSSCLICKDDAQEKPKEGCFVCPDGRELSNAANCGPSTSTATATSSITTQIISSPIAESMDSQSIITPSKVTKNDKQNDGLRAMVAPSNSLSSFEISSTLVLESSTLMIRPELTITTTLESTAEETVINSSIENASNPSSQIEVTSSLLNQSSAPIRESNEEQSSSTPMPQFTDGSKASEPTPTPESQAKASEPTPTPTPESQAAAGNVILYLVSGSAVIAVASGVLGVMFHRRSADDGAQKAHYVDPLAQGTSYMNPIYRGQQFHENPLYESMGIDEPGDP